MKIIILMLVTLFCNVSCAAIDKGPKRLKEKLTVEQRIYYRALPLEERLVIDAYLNTTTYSFQQAIRQMRRDLMCPVVVNYGTR